MPLEEVENRTPFEAATVAFPNQQGVDTLYMVVKASFSIATGVPALTEEQLPILPCDEYWGEPGASSLRYAGELHLAKTGTDVVLNGSAQRRDRRSAESLDVRLRVGPTEKTVRVFGERRWKSGLVSPRIGSVKLFTHLPLLWENAFGGTIEVDGEAVDGEPRNPVGRGFNRKRATRDTLDPLPNLENPKRLIAKPKDQPPPAGFGFVAPYWHTRASQAGTYGDRWQRQRAPYLPEDFDSRFFNAAAPGLHTRTYLQGGEPVELDHASVSGPLRFSLPACKMGVTVHRNGQAEKPRLNLETVLIEPDEERLSLLWRAALPCDKLMPRVTEVIFELFNLNLAPGKAA